MVLINVGAVTLLFLTIVVITSAAIGSANLRRSIATEDDKNKLSYTTATLNDITNNTNNIKHSPTIRKMSNNKIRSLHVSANHRRLVLDGSLVHDNEEGRDEETGIATENERELVYRYDGICEENGQFKLKFRVTVDSDLGSDETIEQLNTFYKKYVSEFNPNDYNNVEMIYYSSLQPTEEEGKFILLWIDGDCIGNVDPAIFLSSVHEFLTADNNLRTTLGEVSVMNCKRFRNSYTCSTPVIPWESDATTSTPVTSTISTTASTSTSSTTAIASTSSSTTVEPITTSSTTQVQVTTTTTQPPPISTTSSTSNSYTQAGAVQATP